MLLNVLYTIPNWVIQDLKKWMHDRTISVHPFPVIPVPRFVIFSIIVDKINVLTQTLTPEG